MSNYLYMNIQIKSIRSFIGSKNYEISRSFYRALGFEEIITSDKMSYFENGSFGFYLQNYFVEEWLSNSMMFLEVINLDQTYQFIQSLELTSKYENVKISNITFNDWGREFFLHDPSGVLWHIGTFN